MPVGVQENASAAPAASTHAATAAIAAHPIRRVIDPIAHLSQLRFDPVL
jgi:hypothetical protein